MRRSTHNTRASRPNRRPFGSWRAVALLVALPAVMAVSCNGDDDDDDDVEVAEAEADGEVRCLIAQVDAGPPSQLASVAPCNSSSSFSDLSKDDLVSVDSAGEAELKFSGCGPIYVFENSSLQLKACRRTSSSAGSSACAISGTSAFQNKGCDKIVTIQTVSAEVVATGTWYTVSVDPATNATLVTVLDGAVEVIPYLEADDPEARGEAQVVDAGTFYYTMPDDQLARLGDIEPRQVTPLVAVSPVIRDLGEVVAFDSVQQRSLADDIDPVLVDILDARVFRIGGFGADSAVAEAVAGSVSWREVIADQSLVLLPPDAAEGVTLSRSEFDPDTAAELLAEIGATDSAVTIIALDDADTVGLVDLAIAQLEEVGLVIADVAFFDRLADAEALFARNAAAGVSTILFGA